MRVSYINYFRDIAQEEYESYLPLLAYLKQVHDPDSPFMSDEEMADSKKTKKICVKILIFLASYLESYIWDFAATYLGEKYAERLDKLSTIDKWEIIPRLVTGKSLQLKTHQLDRFQRLIKERNKLMHHKSIDVMPYIGKETPVEKFPKDLIDIWQRLDMTEFIEATDYVVKELESALERAEEERRHKI